jgi:hypothetical protein
MDFRLFIPITKVDVERRLVYGTVAEEVPDKANEIMDYASARPEFEAWSAEIARASDGKSVGNLRAMHGRVAAGKLESLAFDDEAKKIECCGKVVDDAEWNKVLEGVYTGFSMGGKYLKRWQDADNPALVRYTPQPAEVSLVDNPCIPTATFEVIKEDGTTELRKFRASDVAKAGKLAERNEPVETLATIFHKVMNIVDAQDARIAALEAQPKPGGPVLRGARTVSKGEDAAGLQAVADGDPVRAFRKHLDALPAEQRALALMKFSLANPLPSAPAPRR